MNPIETVVRDQEVRPRRLPVYVAADDQVDRAGLAAELATDERLETVEGPDLHGVGLLAVDRLDEEGAGAVRALLRRGCPQVVVVATALDEEAVLRGIEAGASAVLRRAEATPEGLAAVLVAVWEGHGTLPPDLLGSLLSAGARRLGPGAPPARALLVNGFTEREIEVLRLMADGYDTAEISDRLAWSERTVKNVLHDVTSRFDLRNRCHAVAYALRAGVI